MNIFIYGLINPLKNRFFYIGQTNNLARRFSEHLVDTSDSVKACEMQQLRDLNLVPSIVILEVANEQTANAIEQKWIDFLLAANTELTNTAIADYNSTQEPLKDRWLDKLSLNSSTSDIGMVFLDFALGIKKIYCFQDYFIIYESNYERKSAIPDFDSWTTFDSFISTLSLEAVTRKERETLKFLKTVIGEMKRSIKKDYRHLPFRLLYSEIDGVEDEEHYEFIRDELQKLGWEGFVRTFKSMYKYQKFEEKERLINLLARKYEMLNLIPEGYVVKFDPT